MSGTTDRFGIEKIGTAESNCAEKPAPQVFQRKQKPRLRGLPQNEPLSDDEERLLTPLHLEVDSYDHILYHLMDPHFLEATNVVESGRKLQRG